MDEAQKWFSEGVTLYEKGDYRRAIAAFDKAGAIDPSMAQVWNNRGLALVQLGKYDEALHSIEKAIALDPGYEHAKQAKKLVLDLKNGNGSAGAGPEQGEVSSSALPGSGGRRTVYIAVAAVIIAAALFGLMLIKGGTGLAGIPGLSTPTPTPTAAIPVTAPVTVSPAFTQVSTPTPIPTPTPKMIPPSGVWIEINYDQYYSGAVGIPGNLQQLSGPRQVRPNTGDQFYQIPRNDGVVTATVSKNDGSGDRLTVTVYSNGQVIKNESTILPYSTIDLLATIPIITPTPEETDNSTALAEPA
jgi:FOG: TPR repeat